MKKKGIYLISIMFLMLSCAINPGIKKYTIKPGNHYSNHFINLMGNDTLAFDIQTNESWVWQKPDKNGWSKVTGIAWGNNHKNSVRLVYMRLNDTVGVLGYYYYVNGISPQQNKEQKGILDTITIPGYYHCVLGYNSSDFFVILNSNKHNYYNVSGTFQKKWYQIKTLQHPYIGGTYTINHDWIVKINYDL